MTATRYKHTNEAVEMFTTQKTSNINIQESKSMSIKIQYQFIQELLQINKAVLIGTSTEQEPRVGSPAADQH